MQVVGMWPAIKVGAGRVKNPTSALTLVCVMVADTVGVEAAVLESDLDSEEVAVGLPVLDDDGVVEGDAPNERLPVAVPEGDGVGDAVTDALGVTLRVAVLDRLMDIEDVALRVRDAVGVPVSLAVCVFVVLAVTGDLVPLTVTDTVAVPLAVAETVAVPLAVAEPVAARLKEGLPEGVMAGVPLTVGSDVRVLLDDVVAVAVAVAALEADCVGVAVDVAVGVSEAPSAPPVSARTTMAAKISSEVLGLPTRIL